jgi:hypothetical protein
LAVRDWLRRPTTEGGCGLSDTECDLSFDGSPPPVCGERFVAVHAGSWVGSGNRNCLEEVYGVQVTVTVRMGRAPRDRIGNLLVGPEGEALDRTLEAVRASLHADPRSEWVRQRANEIIGVADNGFVETLAFLGGGQPQAKGPEWFGAVVGEDQGPMPVGIAQTLTFGRAKRVQVVEEAS